jgi:hypothetical protein
MVSAATMVSIRPKLKRADLSPYRPYYVFQRQFLEVARYNECRYIAFVRTSPPWTCLFLPGREISA